MSDTNELVCKPTKWFLWRALALGLMFAVGAFMFFKDWKWGYPNKNVVRYHYLAFEKAESEYRKHQADGKSEADWESFAKEQLIFVPIKEGEDVSVTVPASTDLEKPWPDVLIDYAGYSAAFVKEQQFNVPPAWKQYSNSGGREWSEKPDEVKSGKEIKQQLQIAIVCLVLLVGALFFFLRTLGRSMKVNAEGYTPPGGRLIPFSAMRRIDARKWDTKGLAFVHYEQDGSEKKAKVDGMVYGQFKKEEGEPAQKLYDRILANFQGELIELAPDEDEEEGAQEKAPEKDSSSNDSAG